MKIAIVKLSALGDIVHAMVALQFIKKYRPDVEIDWIVEHRFAGVLQHNPHISRLHTVDIKSLKRDKLRIFDELSKLSHFRAEGYDLMIDAQGLLKSAIVSRLVGDQCAGFDRRSIREPLAAFFYQHKVVYPYDGNTILRNIAVMTQPLGIQVSEQELIDKKAYLHFIEPSFRLKDYLKTDKPNVLLVIGSTWASRNYPLSGFLQIIFQLDANFLICWGNEREHWDAQWLAEHSLARVLPQMSLNDLKAIIAECELVIGNDTGPTHMAWGLNRPSITLFGPTPISRIFVTELNQALKSPSTVDPFNLDKNDFSIGEIPPERVVKLANEILELARSRALMQVVESTSPITHHQMQSDEQNHN